MGSIAFAQVSKNDNTNKTATRKVLDTDIKDLPVDPEANVQNGEIKGETLEKHKGNDRAFIHKGSYKESSIQKSSDASAGKGATTKNQVGEAVYEKQSPKGQNVSGIKSNTTEKQLTIKLTEVLISKVAEDAKGQVLNDESATSMQKKHVSNIKWTPGKAAKDSTDIKKPASSGQFLKIPDEKPKK